MSVRHTFGAALACALLGASASIAGDMIAIQDPYFLSTGPMARSGAAFMTIVNSGPDDDRLVAATSDVAMRVELHTHKQTGDGIMQMMQVEDGFAVPAGGAHELARGGDHVMFMGLTRKPAQGETVTVVLSFENAGDISVELPVRQQR